MKLLQSDSENVVMQMSVKDLLDIASAFSAVGQSYNKVDPSILEMDKPRVLEVLGDLTALVKTMPKPTAAKPGLRAAS